MDSAQRSPQSLIDFPNNDFSIVSEEVGGLLVPHCHASYVSIDGLRRYVFVVCVVDNVESICCPYPDVWVRIGREVVERGELTRRFNAIARQLFIRVFVFAIMISFDSCQSIFSINVFEIINSISFQNSFLFFEFKHIAVERNKFDSFIG